MLEEREEEPGMAAVFVMSHVSTRHMRLRWLVSRRRWRWWCLEQGAVRDPAVSALRLLLLMWHSCASDRAKCLAEMDQILKLFHYCIIFVLLPQRRTFCFASATQAFIFPLK